MYPRGESCETGSVLTATFLGLAAVVALAFTVEATIGFGGTVIMVALGAFLVPIDWLLPAVVPLNIVLSSAIVARSWRAVDVRMLATRIVPAMLAGVPLGLVAFRVVPATWLSRTFAVFVIVLALAELRLEARARNVDPEDPPVATARPLARGPALALLFLGGVIHGAFATGGPMAVYVASRTLGGDKTRFRATLSTLWIVLNCVLAGSYLAMGKIGRVSLVTSAQLAVPLVIGMLAGEFAHHRVPMRHFRRGVYALLAAAGVMLLVKR